MTHDPKAVYKAIAAVTRALGHAGIGKTRKNEQQGYKFRGIDDIYNALSAELAAAELCIIPRIVSRDLVERQTRNGGTLFYVTIAAEYDIVSAVDGSSHTASAYGEAMDSGDKATNKAMSAAYKYMAMQLFCIPTEGDNDADATTHEVMAASYQKPTPPKKPSPSPSTGAITTLATSVKKLRAMERTVASEPPIFDWDEKQGREPLAIEHRASRMRLYEWMLAKGVGNGDGVVLPDLSELDDKSLMDLAYAAAGL